MSERAVVIHMIPIEVRLPLASLPPAVAVCAPVTHEELARHLDAFAPDAAEPTVRARALVRAHLTGFEALELEQDGSRVPYDHANLMHWLSLPALLVDEVYEQLLAEVR